MSANFIVEYAGAPVRFMSAQGPIELVRQELATPFISEVEAILAARNAGLNLHRCAVVNLYLRSVRDFSLN